MVTVDATLFKAVINDSTITATNAEYILDLAIDLLNLQGADLPNMGGSAGSKSVSLESSQKAAVFIAARAIYYGFYKGITNVAASPFNVTTNDLMSNPQVLDSIKTAARQLSEPEVSRG
jgi:hypothetical protein